MADLCNEESQKAAAAMSDLKCAAADKNAGGTGAKNMEDRSMPNPGGHFHLRTQPWQISIPFATGCRGDI